MVLKIDNAGKLEERNGEYFTYFDKKIDAADVVKAVHRNNKKNKEEFWHKFTDE